MSAVEGFPAKSRTHESVDEIALVLKAVLIASDSDDGNSTKPNSKNNAALEQ